MTFTPKLCAEEKMAASGDNFDTSGYSGGESEAWILCCIMSFIEFL